MKVGFQLKETSTIKKEGSHSAPLCFRATIACSFLVFIICPQWAQHHSGAHDTCVSAPCLVSHPTEGSFQSSPWPFSQPRKPLFVSLFHLVSPCFTLRVTLSTGNLLISHSWQCLGSPIGRKKCSKVGETHEQEEADLSTQVLHRAKQGVLSYFDNLVRSTQPSVQLRVKLLPVEAPWFYPYKYLVDFIFHPA